MTFLEEGNQWYEPGVAGPATLIPNCCGAETAREVLCVLERLSTDRYMEFVRKFYRHGLESFGDRWVFADINTVLLGICRTIKIESYLEIGVRQARSMSMVASVAPGAHIVGFDMWIQGYAGMENPGPTFVRDELQRLGYHGNCELIDGDSKITVPRYFNANPNAYFDLITVDGDHSRRGALTDINNVISRLKIGGVLVFDDICNPEHAYLQHLWNQKINKKTGFSPYSFAETGFGVAFAIRNW